jgi:uncharacterized repeat protein (TIGR01451 family)
MGPASVRLVARVRRGCPGLPQFLGALVVCLSAWALAAAPAGAAELTFTEEPLPGSSFQGADGNQDDDPSLDLIDWQALQAGRVVQHNPDPNDLDDAIDGKELNPGGWEIHDEDGGVRPPKANIRDAWSSVRQPDGNTFLYLSFAREAEGGTTYLAFELNTDGRLWNNDGDPDTPRIPCRRTGDVLVAFEPHGNDSNVDVVLQRWDTDEADPGTGCAKTGDLEEFDGLTVNVDAQGQMNDEAITSQLPGAYRGTIPEGRFGETALNLASLLEEAFDDGCLAFRSIWMHSRSSRSGNSSMQDYVAPQPLDVRTCSASGTKFFDRNANGVRDPEDPGIPRFVIFADYDDDGRLDRREPRTVTDNQGHYVLHDIRPPDGTYRLRETLLRRRSRTLPVALDWMCSFPTTTLDPPNGSFPCAGDLINVNTSPNVTGQDFGNWFPARLTVEKVIEPAGDLGQFDLFVDDTLVLGAAGDGDSTTIGLPPGVYDISEVAVPPTNPADYRSTVECRRTVARRGGQRPGTVWEDLPLAAGDVARCTFRNIRPGSPAIAITKVAATEVATAGDTLRYTLYVENPGDVPFPADGVVVSDPICDASPELDEKQDDSGADDSPDTLDPGDTWIYTCSHRTTDPGNSCEPSRVDNTATVTGTTANGITVDDPDSASIILLCPDQPEPPEPPEPPGPPGPGPEPEVPGPVVPPGPRPPNAGDAAAARFLFRQASRRCIANRVPRVNFSGTHIRRVRIYVNGRLRRGLTVQTLQRRVTPRVTLRPGRYRVTARVTFMRGSGTPSVTLSHVIRICAAAAQPAPPPVTG